MDDQKMQIIQQLMEELQDLMQPNGDELGERLGRPKVAAMSMESDGPPDDGDEMSPMDSDDNQDMPGAPGPDDDLKQRLLKLRG